MTERHPAEAPEELTPAASPPPPPFEPDLSLITYLERGQGSEGDQASR